MGNGGRPCRNGMQRGRVHWDERAYTWGSVGSRRLYSASRFIIHVLRYAMHVPPLPKALLQDPRLVVFNYDMLWGGDM